MAHFSFVEFVLAIKIKLCRARSEQQHDTAFTTTYTRYQQLVVLLLGQAIRLHVLLDVAAENEPFLPQRLVVRLGDALGDLIHELHTLPPRPLVDEAGEVHFVESDVQVPCCVLHAPKAM